MITKHDMSRRVRSASDIQGPWIEWCDNGSDELVRIHEKYLDSVENQFILLQDRRDEHHIALPYIVRGMAGYTKRCQRRASNIMKRVKELCLPRGMFITISPRQVGSIYSIHRQIKELWPKFCNWLRMRFGGAYIWAVEPNLRHYSHYHMWLGARHPRYLMFQVILEWFQGHGVDMEEAGVYVEYVRKDPKSYVLKYVTKGSEDPIWNAMLWLDRARAWGASRALGRPRLTHNDLPPWTPATVGPIWIDRVKLPNFSYVGIIDGSDVIKYICESP